MSKVLYGLIWVLFNGLGWLLFRLRTSGRKHVPRRGGLVVAANHASYMDIPLLGCGFPRRLSFLGRQDLFSFPGMKGFLRWLGWIPIRQDRLDRTAVGKTVGLIKSGQAVVIYPEGTRSRDGQLQPGKPGIGVIVAEAGCPVLPVYLGGTHDVLPVDACWPRFRRLRVVIGEPMDFSADSKRFSGKEFYQFVSRTVMARIAELGHVALPKDPSDPFKRAAKPGDHPAAGPCKAE